MTAELGTKTPAVTVRLAMAVLMPADVGLAVGAAPTADHTDKWRFTDPHSALARFGDCWVKVRSSADEDPIRLKLPWSEPDDMYELVETLYLLDGWPGVDAVYQQVQRSLVSAVVDVLGLPKDELTAITALVGADGPLYLPPDHVDLAAQAVGALIAAAEARRWPGVIAGLKAVVPVNGLFAPGTPQAETQLDVSASPEIAARLFADVLCALHTPRRDIIARIVDALGRAEREASRLILTTLTDSRAAIFRETNRYFKVSVEGAERVLKTLTALRIKPGEHGPAEEPRALGAALEKLVPPARRVLQLQGSKAPSLIGPPGPSTVKWLDTLLSPRRAAFAQALGRQAQEFPVLSQFTVEQVEPASNPDGAALPDTVFAILKRAEAANRLMRRRASEFASVVDGIGPSGHPEQALALAVRQVGKGKSVWSYPKYVERAAARVAAGDDVGRKALSDATVAIGAQSEVATQLAQAAGEMLVLHTTTQLASRFVPILNVGLAAWHASVAIQEFSDQKEEFYCALDPRDALVEAAPSLAGLVIDVATEAAFALV